MRYFDRKGPFKRKGHVMSVLNGKVALITGATSGIGKAISYKLAQAGMHVCMVGRNTKALAKQKNELKGSCYITADLTYDQDLLNVKEKALSFFEGIDILVHSAAAISLGFIKDSKIEDLDHQFRLNVRAPYFLTKILLPILEKRKGWVVFINSSAGLVSKAGVSQYSATKHALKAVADSLREEVNPLGIKVLSLYPGQTNTPMQSKIYHMLKKEYKPELLLDPDDVARILLEILTLPKRAEVTDIKIRPFFKP